MNNTGKQIGILFRLFQIFLNRELKNIDLTATELMYLGALFGQPGLSQEELSTEFCIDKAATARSIQNMERKGLLCREIDPSDKRSKQIFLTKQAEKYQAIIETIQKKWVHTMTCDMSETEVKILEAQINAMVEKAKHLVESYAQQEES